MFDDFRIIGVVACLVGDVIYLVIDDDLSVISFVMFGYFLVGIGV